MSTTTETLDEMFDNLQITFCKDLLFHSKLLKF